MTPFIVHRRVEFSDTDLSGIVHFSRFFVFMETAEHAFRRELGFEVHDEFDGHTIGWPRVSATSDFKSPLRFGDLVEIRVAVARRGRSSLTFGFELWTSNRLAATGSLTSVCCRTKEGALELVAIPQTIVDRIDQFLEVTE